MAKRKPTFHKSLEVFSAYTEGWDVARTLSYLGQADMMGGNRSEARNHFLRALRIAFDTNSIPIAIDCLLGLAQSYLREGEPGRVLEPAYYILNHPSSSQEAKDAANALRAELETQLTPTQIEAIQAHTGEKTFDAVVEDLLK